MRRNLEKAIAQDVTIAAGPDEFLQVWLSIAEARQHTAAVHLQQKEMRRAR